MAKKKKKSADKVGQLTKEDYQNMMELRSLLEEAFEVAKKPSIAPYPYDKLTNTISLPAEVDQKIRHISATEGLPYAVKEVAHLTGARLGLSKSYVDNLLGRNKPQQNHSRREK